MIGMQANTEEMVSSAPTETHSNIAPDLRNFFLHPVGRLSDFRSDLLERENQVLRITLTQHKGHLQQLLPKILNVQRRIQKCGSNRQPNPPVQLSISFRYNFVKLDFNFWSGRNC